MAQDVAGAQGVCPPRFGAVRAAFEGAFAAGEELGARFTACLDGDVVVDLWAGFADRDLTRPSTPTP